MSALPSDVAEPAGDGLAGALDPTSKALRTADLGPLKPDGQAGTVFATLDGVPVAVMPLDLYRQLVSAAVAATAPARMPGRSTPKALRTSTIDRDPEVAAFLRERFGQHLTIDALHAACREQFGADRTPSRSRITELRLRYR